MQKQTDPPLKPFPKVKSMDTPGAGSAGREMEYYQWYRAQGVEIKRLRHRP